MHPNEVDLTALSEAEITALVPFDNHKGPTQGYINAMKAQKARQELEKNR